MFDPEGVVAISRGLSEATPPVTWCNMFLDPGGGRSSTWCRAFHIADMCQPASTARRGQRHP